MSKKTLLAAAIAAIVTAVYFAAPATAQFESRPDCCDCSGNCWPDCCNASGCDDCLCDFVETDCCVGCCID